MMAKNNKNVPFDPKVFLATVNGGRTRRLRPGPSRRRLGAKSRAALQLFNRHAATSLNTDEATNKALDAVSGKTARVCPLVCGRGMKADGDTYVAVREPPSRRERESKREPTSKRKPVVKREPPRRRDEVHERGATRARGQACSLWVQQPELRVAYLPGRAPLLHLRLWRYAADYLPVATMRLCRARERHGARADQLDRRDRRRPGYVSRSTTRSRTSAAPRAGSTMR